MTPHEFRHIREAELGPPRSLALALQHLAVSPPGRPLLGIVAAGTPIEPIRQHEEIDIPARCGAAETPVRCSSKERRCETGHSARRCDQHAETSDGRERTDRRGLTRWQATVKKWYRKSHRIELYRANETMSPIIVRPDQDCRIEGIVTGVIRYCG